MRKKVEIDEDALKAKLDPLSYDVQRNAATEQAFTVPMDLHQFAKHAVAITSRTGPPGQSHTPCLHKKPTRKRESSQMVVSFVNGSFISQ